MRQKITVLLVVAFFLALCIIAVKPSVASGDSWVAKTPMGATKTGFGVAVFNDTIYVLGGHPFGSSKVTIDQTSAYDLKTDEWKSRQHMPGLLAWFGTAVYQNEIYVIGGAWFIADSSGTNQVWVYNPQANNWTTKASMPTARCEIQANVVDEKIYVIGGRGTDGGVVAVNEVYDPVADMWSTKTSIPTPVTSYTSAVVDGKIYVISGYTPVANTTFKSRVNLNQIYDPKTDTWSLGTPLPNNQTSISAGATTGVMASKRIYVMGDGLNQIYDPSNDSWTDGTPIPNSAHRMPNFDDAEIAVVNDQLYALGGVYENNGEYYSVNEQYTPVGYGTPDPSTPTPSLVPEDQIPESFPTTSVEIVLGVLVVVLSVSLLFYLKKGNH